MFSRSFPVRNQRFLKRATGQFWAQNRWTRPETRYLGTPQQEISVHLTVATRDSKSKGNYENTTEPYAYRTGIPHTLLERDKDRRSPNSESGQVIRVHKIDVPTCTLNGALTKSTVRLILRREQRDSPIIVSTGPRLSPKISKSFLPHDTKMLSVKPRGEAEAFL